MPRPSNTEKRREEIVEGLLAVMAQHGYAKATVTEIAKAAGLAPGLIHYHFENKREILIALIERMRSRLEARVERRVAAARSPLERLHAAIDAHVALGPDADRRAVAAWVVIAAEAVREEEVRALYATAVAADLRRFKRLVSAALRERGKPTRPAARVASALVAAIEGAYQLSAAAPGVLPSGFAAPALRAVASSLVGG